MSEEDKPYQRVKVTVVAYYEPDLSASGGYYESDGYGNRIRLAGTIAEAAAFDYFSYREGQFSLDEYLTFGGDDENFEVKVEVVTCTGSGETYEEHVSTDISKKVDDSMNHGIAGEEVPDGESDRKLFG